MKILFVGQFKEASLEHHYVKYLSELVEVHTYPAENIFDDYYLASTYNKVKFKFGLSNIYQKIAKGLLDKVKTIRPDIVWVFKGMRLLPQVLEEIRSIGPRLVNYNPDHPFYFSSKGSGNENITKSIGLYDLHFCYDKRVAKRIESEYGIRTAMLPFGYELSLGDFDKYDQEPEINAVCFIGACDKIRVEHVLYLAKNNLSVHVFGSNWKRMLPRNTENITINNSVYDDMFWRNMNKYRLQLNVFKPHNDGCHNMRTFEVPAAGGIMLAPDSPDHRYYFEEKTEIFIYRTKGEMAKWAEKILNLSTEDAKVIRQNARAKSVSAGYSYKERSQQVYGTFCEIMEAA